MGERPFLLSTILRGAGFSGLMKGGKEKCPVLPGDCISSQHFPLNKAKPPAWN